MSDPSPVPDGTPWVVEQIYHNYMMAAPVEFPTKEEADTFVKNLCCFRSIPPWEFHIHRAGRSMLERLVR